MPVDATHPGIKNLTAYCFSRYVIKQEKTSRKNGSPKESMQSRKNGSPKQSMQLKTFLFILDNI